MKKLLLICTTIFFIACNYNTEKLKCETTTTIEEGKRLVTALGCNDCHSPKKND